MPNSYQTVVTNGRDSGKSGQSRPALTGLVNVLRFKILATVLLWCTPIILLPNSVLEMSGVPETQSSWMFVRMLGWAYLSLCVGYYFALEEAIVGQKLKGAIWAGVVSNGGACIFLAYYGISGTWSSWHIVVNIILWGSIPATAVITLGLIWFGLRD